MTEINANIIRIQEDSDAQQAYCCMGEASNPWPESLCDCRDWVSKNLGKHVEGFHIEVPNAEVVGHLYYALSENALIAYEVEPNVGVMYCDWVQTGYQGKGLRTQLFKAFIDEMKDIQAKGILVEATDNEEQKHYRHYSSIGFEVILEQGNCKLLYYPLSQATIEVSPLSSKLTFDTSSGVNILIVNGYMCPFETASIVKTRLIAQEFGKKISLREVQLTPETLREFGVARGIYINGEEKIFGGETDEQIRQVILEAL